ncbi:MAG: pilin [Candidatus Shapirobacteria bacterium]|jgi:hypothetical protein
MALTNRSYRPPVFLAAGFFGTIDCPLNNAYCQAGAEGQGLFLFLSNVFKLAAVAGGLYMIIQFFQAGYLYMTSDGDPKKVAAAQGKIFQSLIGFAIIAGAFLIAGVVKRLTGIDPLNPEIYGPQ